MRSFAIEEPSFPVPALYATLFSGKIFDNISQSLFQECYIEMNVGSGDRESVKLHPLNLTMRQSLDMTLFSITDHVLIDAKDPKKGLRMAIKMKRKIMSEMMTTYFPSLLLLMITYATTFFKPFFFEAALSVNLTTMLVMTTIFISKMEGLPPTSDIKMIDIWLVLCQMVPFVEVVLLTAMEYQRKDPSEEEAAKEMIVVNAISGGQLDLEETEKEGQLCTTDKTRPWLPTLKTIGWF